MKKILTALVICMFVLTALTVNVYAKGSVKPSKTSITIEKGGSTTFKITASNAAGRVDISTSNSSVASISATNKWLDNNSATITVKGKAIGTATITVKLTDVATYDKEPLTNTYKITVKVTEPKSKNNNLSSISVDGYKLVKKSDTSYTLDVGNSVTKITIKATAADDKASVTGTGTKTLKEGKNTFNVIVTAESGAKKTYVITVTRKDGYYLEDLAEALKTSDPTIKLREGDKLTAAHLDKIKSSGKKVDLNAFDKDGNVIYTWKIDGSKLSTYAETDTGIVFDSEYKEEIGKLSNYAEGKYVHFEQIGASINGSTVKMHVGDDFKDTAVLNVYLYNKDGNTLTLAADGLSILNGNVELNLKEYGKYFITRSTVRDQSENSKPQVLSGSTTESVDFKIIAIIEAVVIVVLVSVVIVKSKKRQ
ncbi:MAG: cadherin-like beta sandwich domain-containing protein [Clostridia bacterium]|nr:cadherin-like beta sandwich domain-containing protein [Clostridia bacterium]